jgi:tRNA threonylcarbamoyladenosine biosynthesis protein TsaB
MNLYIDSSNNLKTVIRLGDKEFVTDYDNPREQDVLGSIVRAVKGEGKTIQDITSIEVVTGSGSFTGIRVGVSVANALGFALKVPINGKKVGEYVEPEYGSEPNISRV